MPESPSTGAELFVDALESYGVSRLFGNPGTTELPVMNALEESSVEYRLALHEDVAVGMAAGYAQTRRYHADPGGDRVPVGVANLHITPGVAHGLGNLYGASVAGAPVVVTAGNHGTDLRHEEPILTGDLVEMTDQFTKWSAEVLDVSAMPSMLRRAFRVALTPPTGPVFLAFPYDVLTAETEAEPASLGEIPTGGRGDASQIERAANLLVEADSPAIVLGDGVARAGTQAVDAAVALAEASGARVHGEILACEVDFPASHDQWLSYIPPKEDLAQTLMATDTLVFVGTSTNTTYTPHEEPLVDADATCIHVSADAWEVGKNHRADAAVIGDPGEVMAELADLVDQRLPTEARESRLSDVAAMKEFVELQMQESGEDESDDPRASKAELVDALRDTAAELENEVFVVDEGVTAKYAMLTRWPFEPAQYISNKGGGLGYGLPAAVGAAMAEAERAEGADSDGGRSVVGFIGDGSYLYYPQSIYSAARYDVDLTVVVPDNRNYRILKDNTLDLFGGEEDDYEFIGMDFDPAVDIPANAESHGATARQIPEPDEIADAFEEALETRGPTVLDVLVHD